MVKKFLNSLTTKINFIKSFDKKIEELNNRPTNLSAETPEALLEEYKHKIAAENDVNILEKIKEDFVRPDVLDELSKEFYANLEDLYAEANILDKAEKLKEKYILDLKKLDVEHDAINEKALELQREYLVVAQELGFSQREAEFKLRLYLRESGARIVSREKIYID